MTSSAPNFTGQQVPGATTFPVAPPDPSSSQADAYAPTSWGNYDREITVPSGQKCRVRNLDFTDVMGAGLLDKLNTLQGVVDKHAKKAEGQPPIDPMKLMKDKRTVVQFSEMIDQVVCMVVTAPTVVMQPAKREDRAQGVVYADTVPLADKMEIFQEAMGAMKDLESFRGGSGQSGERVAHEQGDAHSA